MMNDNIELIILYQTIAARWWLGRGKIQTLSTWFSRGKSRAARKRANNRQTVCCQSINYILFCCCFGVLFMTTTTSEPLGKWSVMTMHPSVHAAMHKANTVHLLGWLVAWLVSFQSKHTGPGQTKPSWTWWNDFQTTSHPFPFFTSNRNVSACFEQNAWTKCFWRKITIYSLMRKERKRMTMAMASQETETRPITTMPTRSYKSPLTAVVLHQHIVRTVRALVALWTATTWSYDNMQPSKVIVLQSHASMHRAHSGWVHQI